MPMRISENQRFIATLTFSLILHAVLILGVGFTLSDGAPLTRTLEVIFSNTNATLTPKQADFLAQVNKQGGGNHDKSARPRAPLPSAVAQGQSPITPPSEYSFTTRRKSTSEQKVLSSRHGQYAISPDYELAPQISSGAAHNFQDTDLAQLTAEFNLQTELYAKRPNRKFISASTREYVYANYMRAWVDRAERVGNLNYPDEARQRRLGGKVVITVGVRRDGSVESSRVLSSSGIPLLDDAALRVVRLAQPFPPLPNTSDNTDILQVTRTWLFIPEGKLRDNH